MSCHPFQLTVKSKPSFSVLGWLREDTYAKLSIVKIAQNSRNHDAASEEPLRVLQKPGLSTHWFYAFFFISGFCSLVYEVVWLRLSMAKFGVTTPMVSIVLSVFMAGLGLGSWAGGLFIRRFERSGCQITASTIWPGGVTDWALRAAGSAHDHCRISSASKFRERIGVGLFHLLSGLRRLDYHLTAPLVYLHGRDFSVRDGHHSQDSSGGLATLFQLSLSGECAGRNSGHAYPGFCAHRTLRFQPDFAHRERAECHFGGRSVPAQLCACLAVRWAPR